VGTADLVRSCVVDRLRSGAILVPVAMLMQVRPASAAANAGAASCASMGNRHAKWFCCFVLHNLH